MRKFAEIYTGKNIATAVANIIYHDRWIGYAKKTLEITGQSVS